MGGLGYDGRQHHSRPFEFVRQTRYFVRERPFSIGTWTK